MFAAFTTSPFRRGKRAGYLYIGSAFVLFALPFIIPQVCSAWGIVGHRVVCDIAFGQLSSSDQEKINALVAAYKKPNGKRFSHFNETCDFADTARHNAKEGTKAWKPYARYDKWHYMNVPRITTKVKAFKNNCRSNCVLHAVAFHSRVLADEDRPLQARAEALIFLAHWITDIHQPLHVAFKDDRGGSDIKISPRNKYGGNLHAAWDAGIIKQHRGKRNLRRYIAELSEISESQKKTWLRRNEPIEWAQESYDIATSAVANYCYWTETSGDISSCQPVSNKVTVDKDYIENIAPLLEIRLKQAATRLSAHLAELLNRSDPKK